MKPMVLPEVEAYAEAHSLSESDICRRLREETYRTMDFPQMVVGPLEGAFLKVMAMSVGAKRILEIGTFTGYSALCFAESLPEEGEVITCDIDPEFYCTGQKVLGGKSSWLKNSTLFSSGSGDSCRFNRSV